MLIELTLTSSSLSSPLVMILPVEGMVVSPKRYYVLRSPQSFSIEDKDGRVVHLASDILLEVFQGSFGQGLAVTNIIINGTKKTIALDAHFREVSNYRIAGLEQDNKDLRLAVSHWKNDADNLCREKLEAEADRATKTEDVSHKHFMLRIRLFRSLVDRAADQLGSNCSNDFDLLEFMPDVVDRRRLMQDFHIWNGDPEEFDLDGEYDIGDDSALLSFLCDRILLATRTDRL